MNRADREARKPKPKAPKLGMGRSIPRPATHIEGGPEGCSFVVCIMGQELTALIGRHSVTVTLPDGLWWHLGNILCAYAGSPGTMRGALLVPITAADLMDKDATVRIAERIQVQALAHALEGGAA